MEDPNFRDTPPVPDPFGERVGKAYNVLRDMIIRGRLVAGTRIVEADLAELLAISRTPVRQALGRLEHEGFVVPIGPAQRKRLIVAPMSGADFRELCQLVGAYEGLALERLDEMPPRWRRALAERLAAVNAELRLLISRPERDPDLIFDAQTRFHKTFLILPQVPD